IKSASPDSKPSEIVAASKALAGTLLELKKDAVFTLQYGVNKFDGSWKFDQGEKLVEMAVKTANGEEIDPKTSFTSAFLGVIDPSDGTMRLYPLDRKGYEEARGKNDKGMQALSVRLNKEG